MHGYSGCARSDRVTDSDGAAIDVGFLLKRLPFLFIITGKNLCRYQRHGGKGLINLDDVHLINRHAYAFQCLFNGQGRDDRDIARFGSRADRCQYRGEWLQSLFFRLFSCHEEDGAGAGTDGRRIARRNRGTAIDGPQLGQSFQSCLAG